MTAERPPSDRYGADGSAGPGFGTVILRPPSLVSRHRSSVGLRCAPMAARSLRHLIRDATLGSSSGTGRRTDRLWRNVQR
ncbi:hypothetical protein [Verminephrobacter eiseniae]|uniref:hypothetical protein n=1 Tax=Verminephrobacter eiseniae TaxID=364317 RepID=UPI0000DC9F94|nr:hypothetical protein [Verminephrobacter eiseniae]